MEEKKKIVLVDDHVVVRNGLKELVEKLGPYRVTDEFDDGISFLNALPLSSEPNLVILDFSMPGMNGDQVLEALRVSNPDLMVLVLTLNKDDDVIIRMFRNGVRGYLPKDCSAKTLQLALDEIFNNGYYHNEFLTMSLRNSVMNKQSEQETILKQLTPREKEFLGLVCHEKEYTYEQIADKMNVQHRTVDGYREAIFEKFNIKSKTGLVLFVLKHKLFEHLQIS